MTKKAVGYSILSAVILAAVIATVVVMGWRDALIVWTVAPVLCGLLIYANDLIE